MQVGLIETILLLMSLSPSILLIVVFEGLREGGRRGEGSGYQHNH
jgi:hypothetical protein